MKKITIICLLAVFLLAFFSCGDRTYTYAYYEFVCSGEMTVTYQPPLEAPQKATLSDGDIETLLRVWGDPWEGEKTDYAYDYEFAWENTAIRYSSDKGVFHLAGSGLTLVLPKEDRAAVESIIDHIF